MPKTERWDNLPTNVREHPTDRMRERAISLADLHRLRLWIIPDRTYLRVIGTRILDRSKYAGADRTPKTFLLSGQIAKGESL
jgi:hypothetical protein